MSHRLLPAFVLLVCGLSRPLLAQEVALHVEDAAGCLDTKTLHEELRALTDVGRDYRAYALSVVVAPLEGGARLQVEMVLDNARSQDAALTRKMAIKPEECPEATRMVARIAAKGMLDAPVKTVEAPKAEAAPTPAPLHVSPAPPAEDGPDQEEAPRPRKRRVVKPRQETLEEEPKSYAGPLGLTGAGAAGVPLALVGLAVSAALGLASILVGGVAFASWTAVPRSSVGFSGGVALPFLLASTVLIVGAGAGVLTSILGAAVSVLGGTASFGAMLGGAAWLLLRFLG